MRTTTVLFGAAILAMCSVKAQAQMTEVWDTQMSYYDVSGLKGGEWVESETKMEYPGVAMPATKSKLACVKVDGDSVWIETVNADQVVLYQIAKKDRKITKAWSGKVGEEGKELAVKPAPAAGSTEPPKYEISGTGKVSKEKLSISGKDVECEKVEMDTTTKMSGMEMKAKTTTWYSTEYPFKFYVDDKAPKQADPYEKIKWEGDKPSMKGGMVKTLSEANGGKSITAVIGWGSDAKPSLKMK